MAANACWSTFPAAATKISTSCWANWIWLKPECREADGAAKEKLARNSQTRFYNELNRYGVGSPCRNVCTVCGSPPCPDFC
ncbi:hypothetical protein ELB75_07595 [Eikenella corrodens]|uniref:Uncharacterized protein n=1 Tax=Eikenella corrodens TaxID=539 RepID=A0A3S9SK76_EIKCO|nr:hypothetical protein ELB75_07595 [Eikenella corrodens]